MTKEPGRNCGRHADTPHLMNYLEPRSEGHRIAGGGSSPATSATVGLATAALALGINPATAEAIAEHDEFPCQVIRTNDGYRVPFAALLPLLRSRSDRSAGQTPGPGHPDGSPP